jgi:hypothetical protein
METTKIVMAIGAIVIGIVLGILLDNHLVSVAQSNQVVTLCHFNYASLTYPNGSYYVVYRKQVGKFTPVLSDIYQNLSGTLLDTELVCGVNAQNQTSCVFTPNATLIDTATAICESTK